MRAITIDPNKPCQRRFKVQAKGVHRCNTQGATVSELRLNGKWLGDYGFKIGRMVTLQVKYRKITIIPDDIEPIDDADLIKQHQLYRRKMREIASHFL